MPVLIATGLNVPASFPAASFDAAHQRITNNHPSDPITPHFRGAWNALSYRYYEALETADEFASHFGLHGEGPPPLERYQQERMLFDFFGAAVASLEAYFYGMYALAAIAYPTNFPLVTLADERRVNPTHVLNEFRRHLVGDPSIAQLDAIYASSAYTDLRTIRNVLTHRTAPGRAFFMSIGSPGPNPPAIWNLTGTPLTGPMLATAIGDLTALFQTLLPVSEDFANAHC